MGFWKSTYFGFGVHVPQDRYDGYANQESDRLDSLINGNPVFKGTGVGHLTAGAFDQNELFLIVQPNDTYDIEVELGEFMLVTPELYATQIPAWTDTLHVLSLTAGYGDLPDVGWLVIPDES